MTVAAPPRWRLIGGQAAWTLADQAFSSLGTLILAVAVAQRAGLVGFGAYATVITLYALALTGARALLSTPYLMRAASSHDQAAGMLAAGMLGAALLVALPLSVVTLAAASAVGAPLAGYLVVLAGALPVLLLQDCYRFVLRQADRYHAVALNDGIWTAVQAGLSLALLDTALGESALAHVGAWGAGAAVAVGHGWAATRTAPDLRAGRRFLTDTRRLGIPLLVEAFAVAGSNSVGQFAIAATGGAAALAPIKGAHVVLGPVNVVNSGLVFLVTPVLLRTGAADRRRLVRHCGLFGLVIAAASVASGALLLVLPQPLGVAMLGETWAPARQAVLPTALALAAYGAQTAAMLGFRAHRNTTRSMLLRLCTFPLPVVAGLAGLAVAGPLGAAYGLCAGATVTAAVLWVALLRLPASPAVACPAVARPPSDAHPGARELERET
jgi:O-antigen/teichoic acid export membrane protein